MSATAGLSRVQPREATKTRISKRHPAHRDLLELVATIVGITIISVAAQFPVRHQSSIFFVTNVLVSVALATTAVMIRQLQHENKLAVALFAGSGCWAIQWLGTWNRSIFPILGLEANAMFYVTTAWGILSYPKDVLRTKAERWFLRALWLMPIAEAGHVVFSTPESEGYRHDVLWPSLWTNTALRHDEFTAAYLGMLLLALAFVPLIQARLKRMRGIDQLVSKPLAYGFCLVGLVSGISETTQFYPTTELNGYYFRVSLAVLSVPIGLAIALLKKRIQHAQIAETLYEHFARDGITTASVETALRQALNDPTISILYWSPNAGCYVNNDGHATDRPRDTNELRVIRTLSGEELAIVLGDASLKRHSSILATAINASGMALENAQLQANVLSQLELLRNSRARIAEAGLAERRRIERDLHDGVQQRLLALSTRLGTASRSTEEATTQSALTSINDDLLLALAELRNLANGIHPIELRQFGLQAAIQSLVSECPFEVSLELTNARFTPAIESTTYFFISESIANIYKHAQAGNVSISAVEEQDALVATVCDDGIGIEHMEPGMGLLGLRDRVQAIGGTLTIEARRDGGTSISARIDLASDKTLHQVHRNRTAVAPIQ